MWPNPQLPADLVTFTEEILNAKLQFLYSIWKWRFKNVGIRFKIISFQYPWGKWLDGGITHVLKLIPLHIITQNLGNNSLFHSILYINLKKTRQFTKYYQKIFSKWSSNLSVLPRTSSTTTSQIIWYNKHFYLVDKKCFYKTTIADKGINQVG